MSETLPRTGFVVKCAAVELSQGNNCNGRTCQYVANLKGTDVLPTIRLISLLALTMRGFFLLCLLPSAIYAWDLEDLVSASNDFEVQMIEHEHVLERNPSASELAESTLKYAKAKERYFVELRKSVPTLIDMATGKAPKTPEIDKLREIFSGYGEVQEKRLEAATVSMLKQHEGDAEVSKAEIEFYRGQKLEDQFHKDFDGLDST